MRPDPVDEKRLEELLDRTLRDLPPRRAPHGLESRVFIELERRASSVWWRRDFKTWPVAARSGFFLLSLGLIALTLLAGRWSIAIVDPWRDAGAALAVPVDRAVGFLLTMQDLGRLMTRLIPPGWVYYGALVAAGLYGCLFGLCTVAYGFLYLKPGRGGRMSTP